MISTNNKQQVVITLRDSQDTHGYNVQAMVRVLALAFGSEIDDDDRECLKTYCIMLEEMLPLPKSLSKGEGLECAGK
jgi:hypothetical protein